AAVGVYQPREEVRGEFDLRDDHPGTGRERRRDRREQPGHRGADRDVAGRGADHPGERGARPPGGLIPRFPARPPGPPVGERGLRGGRWWGGGEPVARGVEPARLRIPQPRRIRKLHYPPYTRPSALSGTGQVTVLVHAPDWCADGPPRSASCATSPADPQAVG